jgi:hypothetical protein
VLVGAGVLVGAVVAVGAAVAAGAAGWPPQDARTQASARATLADTIVLRIRTISLSLLLYCCKQCLRGTKLG